MVAERDGQLHAFGFTLMRWQCAPPCKATFSHYPPGVMPYLRYLAGTVQELCEQYLRDEKATYAKVVTKRGVAIVHAGTKVAAAGASEAAKRAEKPAPRLCPSQVWRWIGSQAWLWLMLKPRWERRQIEADRADLSPWQIAPRKYRSLQRREELIDCGRVLEVLRKTTDFASMALGP